MTTKYFTFFNEMNTVILIYNYIFFRKLILKFKVRMTNEIINTGYNVVVLLLSFWLVKLLS